MVTLCMAYPNGTCGRPDLEDAIAHARERAAFLRTRQRVTVQRDAQLGAHFVISTARA